VTAGRLIDEHCDLLAVTCSASVLRLGGLLDVRLHRFSVVARGDRVEEPRSRDSDHEPRANEPASAGKRSVVPRDERRPDEHQRSDSDEEGGYTATTPAPLARRTSELSRREANDDRADQHHAEEDQRHDQGEVTKLVRIDDHVVLSALVHGS